VNKNVSILPPCWHFGVCLLSTCLNRCGATAHASCVVLFM
jgi:hypothetical protein